MEFNTRKGFGKAHFPGKELPILVNLEPSKFKGTESQGMVLAVDIDGKPVLLRPEEEVPPRSIVR